MKKMLGLAAMAIVLMGLATGCAKSDEDMQPVVVESGLRDSVQGKWRIERVQNKLCRSGDCTSVIYTGTADDYFEFKADSAYLQRASQQNAKSVYRDSFKADYSQPGAFVLSNFGWSARFNVLHRDQRMLVLEGVYYGSNPSAIFTDTYYLYR
ncbi:hypothetical protein [Pontibacter ramchanderi]|uniref:Lipocalin-like protein n=1 Tax=Pontibacter ramchanderi TaxID=1179743 RepID=A0A2N3UBN4_9BACT|nr:hypothetical protein [Pontibacter ramchanderi]PKV66784.1 hypothetical protein BD749_1918 [Pontibacter ramchanderi]